MEDQGSRNCGILEAITFNEYKNIRDRHDATTSSEGSTSGKEFSLDDGSHSEDNSNISLPLKYSLDSALVEEAYKLKELVTRVIEEPQLKWLHGTIFSLSEKEITLLAVVVSAMALPRGQSLQNLSGMPLDKIMKLFQTTMSERVFKRKDQKLRMVYGSLLKMMFKISAKKKGRYPRVRSFVDKYGLANPQQLESAIFSCRVPSRKRLVSFFVSYPEIYSDAQALVENGDCLKSCLQKQVRRVQGIVGAFLKNWNQGDSSIGSLRSAMKESLAHLPWSSEELASSLKDLIKIFKEAGGLIKLKQEGVAFGKLADLSQKRPSKTRQYYQKVDHITDDSVSFKL